MKTQKLNIFSQLQNDVTIQTHQKQHPTTSYSSDVLRPFPDQSGLFWSNKFSNFPLNFSSYRFGQLNNPNSTQTVPFNPMPFLPASNLIQNPLFPKTFASHSLNCNVTENNSISSPGNFSPKSNGDPQENDVTTSKQSKDDEFEDDVITQYD